MAAYAPFAANVVVWARREARGVVPAEGLNKYEMAPLMAAVRCAAAGRSLARVNQGLIQPAAFDVVDQITGSVSFVGLPLCSGPNRFTVNGRGW